MAKKIPAYGARAAKAPLEPMTIERRDPGRRDIETEILFCGICHSDVHKVNDDWGTTHFPVVPSHEIARARCKLDNREMLAIKIDDIHALPIWTYCTRAH